MTEAARGFNLACLRVSQNWKSDLLMVLQDPHPGLFTPTFWEMYWNISGWVVDIFVDPMKGDVAQE